MEKIFFKPIDPNKTNLISFEDLQLFKNKLVKLSKIIDKKEMSDPMLFCVEKVKEVNI
ncbi:hypothetical protein [Candidatus Pelagibacter sp. Uisw_127]|uniref:hypothetical protein n=1 Tax=Candidatus Pelagibacter sp. Uisw_127 TaxID=3230988 RepID=UPI0039E8B437